MTCIIGIEDEGSTLLLADSMGSSGWDQAQRRDGKLHTIAEATPTAPGVGLGFTSSYRMGQVLGYGLRSKDLRLDRAGSGPAERHQWAVETFIPKVRDLLKDAGWLKIDSSREEGGCFLLAVGEVLLEVQADLQVASPLDGYSAVGSGYPFALGALHAAFHAPVNPPSDALVLGFLAMDAAVYHARGVGGRIDTLRIQERA